MTWFEKLPPKRDGYSKRRMMVRTSEEKMFRFPAEKICAGCGQPIGFDRLWVRHYRYYHLPCWQVAFPDLAAQDRQTRGECETLRQE